jgi:hypothetical protein
MSLRLFASLRLLFHDPWVKPSREIAAHLDGTGSGFELDDLNARARLPWHREVCDRIDEIDLAYRDAEHGWGTTNPAARPALLVLQEDLEKQGR